MTDLLLIDANQDRSSSLAEQLASQGIQVKEAAELGNLALGQFDCLLLDRAALPSDLSAVTEQLPVVVMADDGDVADAVRTMHLGVKDYLLRPIKIDELMAAIERAWCISAEYRQCFCGGHGAHWLLRKHPNPAQAHREGWPERFTCIDLGPIRHG